MQDKLSNDLVDEVFESSVNVAKEKGVNSHALSNAARVIPSESA
jgi:hypothetical protein